MKTKNISISLIAIMCAFINMNVFSQTFVRYDYDDAGNRIQRQVITIPPKLSPQDSLQYVLEHPGIDNNMIGAGENLGDCKVTIYPNPTGGMFTLEINGSFDSNSSLLTLYSLTGVEINFWKNLVKSNRIDISTYPAGNYILKLSLNGLATSWKLIKE